eukprot:7094562-Pyramimonas_sp.AAC.1
MFRTSPLDDATSFGRCVHALRMVQRMLLRLGSLLLTDKCHALEGWFHVPPRPAEREAVGQICGSVFRDHQSNSL